MVPNIAIRSANRWLCEIIFNAASYADLSWENQIFVISTKPHKYGATLRTFPRISKINQIKSY